MEPSVLPPPSTFSAPTARLRRREVATGLLVFVLIGVAQSLYGPSIPGLSREFALGAGTVGLLISAHALGALFGVLATIPLEGRPTERWRAGTAVVLVGLGALGLGLAPSWPLMLASAFVLGIGYGAATVGLNALFAGAFGARSAAMLNLLNALFGVGSILGPLIVGASVPLSTRAPFLVAALAALLLAPFAFGLDDRVPALPVRTQPRGARRGLAAFVALLALGVGVETSSAGWSATYLVSLGRSPGAAASFTALFYVVFTLGRFTAAGLSLRLQPAAMVLGALSLVVVFLAAARVPALAGVSLALVGGAVSAFFPNALTWLRTAVPPLRGGTALVVAGSLLGATVFPALVGAAVTRGGGGIIPLAVLALALVTLGFAGLLAARLKRH